MDSHPPFHAGCVAFGRRGLLILGKPSSGKSSLALGLMNRGGKLVSDDYSLLSVERGRLYASSPVPLKGLVEFYEVGIISLPGRKIRSGKVRVFCAVELIPGFAPERGEMARQTITFHEQVLPLLKIDPGRVDVDVRALFFLDIHSGRARLQD